MTSLPKKRGRTRKLRNKLRRSVSFTRSKHYSCSIADHILFHTILSSLQTKLGRRLSARVISLLSPSKEKSKKESELVAPTETENDVTPSATSDAAPSVTTEIPAGSLITASAPIVPEVNSSTTPATEEHKDTTTSAPPAAPVVAGEFKGPVF